MGFVGTSSRAAVLAALCACFALSVPAAAGASAPPASASSLATVKVIGCQRGADASQRVATFRAGMRRIPGASRLSVRFKLQESVAGGAYRFVKAPGIGVWRNSRPGVVAFAYRQKVRALAQGSAYRVWVSYRWQNAEHEVLKRTKRRSRACRQTDPLPNLRIQRIGGKAVLGAPDRTSYAVTVINSGTASSPAAALALTVDGSKTVRATVGALAPGQITRVLLEGPKCSSGVSAEVDPDALVQEASEVDNDRSAPCPAT
jgi:hypothetical protein